MIDESFAHGARVQKKVADIRALVRRAADSIQASEATFWLVSGDGRRLDAAVNVGPSATIVERASVDVADSIVGMVASTGLATCIGPDDPHNMTVDEATGTRTVAMAAACVIANNRVVGVLSAINPKDHTLFDSSALAAIEKQASALGRMLEDG